MSAPFRRLHHICLVVSDIDDAVAYYDGMGIGPWLEYPPLDQYTDLDVPDPDVFRALQYRYVNLENVQIQLCQPPESDCSQRRFLDTHGQGVFHIGFEASLDEGVPAAESAGLHVLMSGRRVDGTGFAYFDTERDAGVTWMIRQTKPVIE